MFFWFFSMEIEIFRIGTHRDMGGRSLSFGDDVLAQIADYDPANPAPIVIGHPRDNSPAYGWIKSIRQVGDRLLATPERLNPDFLTALKAGSYRRVSASLFPPDAPANPRPGRWSLRHLGFLGGAAPAIPGLALPEFADGGALTYQFTTVAIMDLNILKDIEGDITPADVAAAMGVDEAMLMALLDAPMEEEEMPPEFAELNRKNAALQARLEAMELARVREKVSSFCDALIAQGKPLPLPKGAVVDFVVSLDRAKTYDFADTKKVTPHDFALELLKHLPQQVKFGEVAGGGSLDFADDSVAIEKAIKQKQKEGLSYAEAVSKVMGAMK